MERRIGEKVAEVKRQCDLEKQRAVEDTKKKQWCANCGKEALFFCCWNTSYCDYPCQVGGEGWRIRPPVAIVFPLTLIHRMLLRIYGNKLILITVSYNNITI